MLSLPHLPQFLHYNVTGKFEANVWLAVSTNNFLLYRWYTSVVCFETLFCSVRRNVFGASWFVNRLSGMYCYLSSCSKRNIITKTGKRPLANRVLCVALRLFHHLYYRRRSGQTYWTPLPHMSAFRRSWASGSHEFCCLVFMSVLSKQQISKFN
jgi:hypothetical protein